MDPIQVKKIHAMNGYRRRQFLDNLYFYFLTALTCSVFCFITLCLPYLSSLVRLFFVVLIPSFASVLFSSKLLFIVGNLIIFALIVDSRILSSTTHAYYYDEYIKSSQTQRPQIPSSQVKKAKKLEKNVAENVDVNREERGELSVIDASDELNRRADEFIARVIRQRRLELSPLECKGYN